MKKSKNWIKIYLMAVASVWLLVVGWALTESEPPQGRGYYGNVMTITDQGSADLFGVAGPGIYVVNKNHKPVTAVRGGLGMIIRGVFTGDSSQASVGWRGLAKGLTRTASGIFLLGVIVASVVGFFVALFLQIRKPRGMQAQAPPQG